MLKVDIELEELEKHFSVKELGYEIKWFLELNYTFLVRKFGEVEVLSFYTIEELYSFFDNIVFSNRGFEND